MNKRTIKVSSIGGREWGGDEKIDPASDHDDSVPLVFLPQ